MSRPAICVLTLLVLLSSAIAQSGTARTGDFSNAQRLMEQGKFEEAIDQLQDLRSKNPALKGLAHEFGLAYYKKGDHIQAIDAFKRALEEDSADKEAVQLLGLSNYLSGRPADAIPLLEKVQGWYP